MLHKEYKEHNGNVQEIVQVKTQGGIQLFSGLIFSPLWPTPDTFTIEDLAHGLMNMSRFGGQSVLDYSVAQHCVIMSRWFRSRGRLNEARWALLHEGSEGLGLGDMPTPIKYLPEMGAYRTLCKNVDFAVFRKFGLLGKPPKEVKELDTRMYYAEAKICYRDVPKYILEIDTSDIIVKPYKKRLDAKKYFLNEYKILF